MNLITKERVEEIRRALRFGAGFKTRKITPKLQDTVISKGELVQMCNDLLDGHDYDHFIIDKLTEIIMSCVSLHKLNKLLEAGRKSP